MISTMERVGNRGIRNLIAQSHPLVETTDTISPNKDINHVLMAHIQEIAWKRNPTLGERDEQVCGYFVQIRPLFIVKFIAYILQVNRLLDLRTQVFSIAINFLTYTESYEFKTISYKNNCFVRIYFCKSHFSVTDFILRAIWYIFFVQ